jgi:HKD family nuclease
MFCELQERKVKNVQRKELHKVGLFFATDDFLSVLNGSSTYETCMGDRDT